MSAVNDVDWDAPSLEDCIRYQGIDPHQLQMDAVKRAVGHWLRTFSGLNYGPDDLRQCL